MPFVPPFRSPPPRCWYHIILVFDRYPKGSFVFFFFPLPLGAPPHPWPAFCLDSLFRKSAPLPVFMLFPLRPASRPFLFYVLLAFLVSSFCSECLPFLLPLFSTMQILSPPPSSLNRQVQTNFFPLDVNFLPFYRLFSF